MADSKEVKPSKFQHAALFIYIGRQLDPAMEQEYKAYKNAACAYLEPSDIATATQTIDILNAMQTRRHIAIGNYSNLVNLLRLANLESIAAAVEQKAEEIRKQLELERAGSSQTALSRASLVDGCSKFLEKSNRCSAYSKEKILDLLVETSLVREVNSNIREKNALLLLGDWGDGKSFILHHLLANPPKGYHPIACKSPKDIEKYLELVQGSGIKLLVVIDDTFGPFMQEKLVFGWVNKGPLLEMYLKEHKFVFASRRSVWIECNVFFRKSLFFCNQLEVISSRLTTADKHNMLQKYLLGEEGLKDIEIDSIVHSNNPIAFCQCCKLMHDAMRQGTSGKALSDIFRRPVAFLLRELAVMATSDKVKYATLCLVMLCGGRMPCKDLDGTLSDIKNGTIREAVSVALLDCKCPNSTVADLQQSANFLTGIYLEKREESLDHEIRFVYGFSHDSMHETIIMKFGGEHFGHCLKFLTKEVLVTIVRSHNYIIGENEFAVNVPMEYYTEVAEVFIEQVIVAKSDVVVMQLFANPLVVDETFLDKSVDYLKSRPDKKALFCFSKPSFYLYGKSICILFWVARAGSSKILKILMDDLSIRCQCPEIFCPLEGAVTRDEVDIIEYLLSHKSQKPSVDQLHKAVISTCQDGHIKSLEVLFKELKSVNSVVMEESLIVACTFGYKEIVAYILRLHDGSSLILIGMMAAAKHGQSEIVSLLLSFGADAKIVDRNGMTALHHAASWGHDSTVEYLISKGAEVNTANRNGMSSLHLAAQEGHSTTVRSLVEQGADVNMCDKYSITPLHRSLFSRYNDAVYVLLDSGANVNAIDEWGQTPLHVIMTDIYQWDLDSRMDDIEALLRRGTDVNIRDKWNRTALHLAEEHGVIDVVNVFSKFGHRVGTRNCRRSPYSEGDIDMMEDTDIGNQTTDMEGGAEVIESDGNSHMPAVKEDEETDTTVLADEYPHMEPMEPIAEENGAKEVCNEGEDTEDTHSDQEDTEDDSSDGWEGDNEDTDDDNSDEGESDNEDTDDDSSDGWGSEDLDMPTSDSSDMDTSECGQLSKPSKSERREMRKAYLLLTMVM